MTKTKQSLVTDPAQMNLFDSIVRDQEERQAQRPGRMCTHSRLHAAINAAIKGAAKSREQIVDNMNALQSRRVTVSMINNWTSSSHPHEMTIDLLNAFCEATGDYGLIVVITDTAGIYTVEPPEKIRAKIQKLDEQKKELDRAKQKYSALLHELEARK